MNPPYTKGIIVRPPAMSNSLLAAYLRKLKEFNIKPLEGARYDGKQTVHYFTCMDGGAHAIFCVIEDEDNDPH